MKLGHHALPHRTESAGNATSRFTALEQTKLVKKGQQRISSPAVRIAIRRTATDGNKDLHSFEWGFIFVTSKYFLMIYYISSTRLGRGTYCVIFYFGIPYIPPPLLIFKQEIYRGSSEYFKTISYRPSII